MAEVYRGYTHSVGVEEDAWERFFFPFFKKHSQNGIVKVEKGRLARDLQVSVGDLLLNRKGEGELLAIECKAEQSFTGNLFIETFSNRDSLRQGWLYSLRSDLLAYLFLDVALMFIVNLPGLQDWMFGAVAGTGRMYRLKEREQKAYNQNNRTWGRLAPIRMLAPVPSIRLVCLDMEEGGSFRVVSVDESHELARFRQEGVR